jgi:spore coat polysaccharide biosynthesis protein SpsF
MNNILAVIQARLGSTRLPGKVLLGLEGKTVLEHVALRVKASRFVDKVIVATTLSPEDRKIVVLCKSCGIAVFCGSTEDVLDRFYQAVLPINPSHIVRITGDCPLMDPKVIDEVIKQHLAEKSDYTTNTLKETYPDGEDVEIFTFTALQKAWENARLSSEREHVTPYIRKNPVLFKLASVENKEDLGSKRWTIDNPEDYEFIKKIYKALYKKNNLFGADEILAFLKRNPELEKINQHIIRNEGYAKSLEDDKTMKKTRKR